MVKANCHFDYHHTIGKVDAAWILSRFHPHRTHFSSNRLRHFNPKDKTFRSASTIFVADSIRFQSLGPRDRCQASKSRFQAQGISLAMWHHPCSRHHPPTLIYFFFYTPLLSPAKDGAPHLLAWSCGTLGWRRRSPIPRLRVRVPDGEPVLRLEMGNNKETRRRPVSFHPEGVVSFAGERGR
jgi:hypothetical protein